ncbi:MAG TPA: hypothetical protein VMB26_07990 [Candidatus Binataceae bacterium]|nr:hypothetical protein [Candidatus Binataceae bacterium]
MSVDGIKVEIISSRESFEKFAAFPNEIYGSHDAWWPPDIQSEVDLISGRSPIAAHLDLAPMWARREGRLVARVSAVVNHRCNRQWDEKLGQLIHFEAIPGESAAVVALLSEAGHWLKSRGMAAMRSGFAAFLDYPYTIDNYHQLPSFLLRGNPDYYHCYFKNAGFETEKGFADFTAELTPQMQQRYASMVTAAERGGFLVQSWREYGFLAAVDAWTDVTNQAFARHWGWNPVTRQEVRPMLSALAQTPVADLSTVASVDGRPIGAVFSVPDLSQALAQIRPGVKLPPERGGGTRGALINIGVVEGWRGRGVNLATAGRSFLTMAALGMRYAGYTLVLDDNWASRATAQKLGASITGNFVVYRRQL